MSPSLPLASTSQLPLSVATSKPPLTAQPFPSYVLRSHTHQISILLFSSCNKYLYAGDAEGFVSIWDLKSYRPLYFWKAHEAGVLSLKEFEEGIITHARDNKIHFFTLDLDLVAPSSQRAINPISAISAGLPSPSNLSGPPSSSSSSKSQDIKREGGGRNMKPEPKWSLDVNAMAFSKLSLVILDYDSREAGSSTASKGKGRQKGLIAVPSLVRDEMVDIFAIPGLERIHRSIGGGAHVIRGESDKTGTIMALQLFYSPVSSSSSTTPPSESTAKNLPSSGTLHLLAGYESGQLTLYRCTGTASAAYSPPKGRKEEGEDWELIWEEKGHREALMDVVIAPDGKTAWSVGADHYICRYRLFDDIPSGESRLTKFETTAPGRSALGIRNDGKLLAVAGWDGEARLYSTKSGAPLAVLSFHRASLHALAWANPTFPSSDSNQFEQGEEDEDEEVEDEEEEMRKKDWLAVGGKDGMISLWEVYARS